MRDGGGNYHTIIPDAISGTTISSADYNANLHDVANDLNFPRPILCGGTGASNATDARANLKCEVSEQYVADYDTHVWESGSFFSDFSAHGAPLTSANFTGVYASFAPTYPDYANVVAIDNATGISYIRRKVAGVWSAWQVSGGDKVAKAGDTMTGNLAINAADPGLVLQSTGVGSRYIAGQIGASAFGVRWVMRLGTPTAESGGNAGSDFDITRYDDSGAVLDQPLAIQRSTGKVTVAGDPTSPLGVATKQYADAQSALCVLKAGDTMTGSLGIGGTLGVGRAATSYPMVVHAAADQNLFVTSHDALAQGICLQSVNDGVTALMPMEIKASTLLVSNSVAGAVYLGNNLGNQAISDGSNYFIRTNGAFWVQSVAAGNTTYFTADGTKLNVPLTTASTSPTTGALTVAGGLGVGGAISLNSDQPVHLGPSSLYAQSSGTIVYSGNTHWFQNVATSVVFATLDATKVNIPLTTASTSPTAGALTVAGGVGVSGNINVGGDILWAGATSNAPGIGSTSTGGALGAGGYIAASRGSGSALHINTNTDGTIQLIQRSGVGVGSISVTTTSTAYNTSSDARLKTDLQPFDAGPIIDQTNVYDFAWIATGERSHGVIAQEATQVFPEAVSHDEQTDMFGIDYSRFVPLLLQEIKSLRARVAALETAAI